MKNYIKIATMSVAALLLAPGIVSAETFNTTGNMADNGAYGNELYFKPTTAGSTLQLRVTGWQADQNNAINSAWVGAYSPGLGVTGVGDYQGDYGYHQIDNAGGRTDFLLLQFNAPVFLNSLLLNSFTLGSASGKDNDLAIYAANIPEASWNQAIDLTKYSTVPSTWTTIAGSGGNGVITTGVNLASRQWLVGAAFNSGGNDGFKIAAITTTPVPEPTSWAMMIVGLGMVGFALRSRRGSNLAPGATARA